MVEGIAIIYIESEVQAMRTEKKELNIQIGKRLQTVRENSRYTQEAFAEALDIGVQYFQTAIKEYMSLKDKKISRLIEYAEKLGIRDEVMKYVEVLV